jgi:hypothetical protein
MFEPCFTAPSYRRFLLLMPGWLVCIGKRTVTGVMRAAGVADQDTSGFQRFFGRGAWSPDSVGRVVLQMVLKLLAPEQRVELTLDDTLARHTGKHIASAGMHRDPLLSTAAKPYFHFGHNWVVLAVALPLPWGKVVSLPFFVRLYRTAKAAEAAQVEHFKRTVLAAQMLAELVKYETKRRFLVFSDNAYVNRSVVRTLPVGVDLVGRGRMDAALYAPPPAYHGVGRPRIKGKRLDSPEQRAAKGRWKKLEVSIYGRPATVQVKTFEALWYIVGGGRTLRFVLVRGWPGHQKDDVLVSTDLSMTAAEVIEAGGDLRLGQEPSGLRGPSQPHRARRATHRANGALGLLHRGGLVRPVGAQTHDAADAARQLVSRQDRAELCGHARHITPTMLDNLGF